MVKPNSKIMFCDGLIGYGVQGTIAKTITYRLRHGNGHYGAILNRLYQDKFSRVVPTSINNPESDPYRAQWKAAVLHWQYALTADEKKEYNRRAHHILGMSGYNLFMREAMKGEIEMFIDRGDPTSADWTEVDFILDTTWRDLDLSAIVPAGAKCILFSFRIRDAYINKDFALRRKGNVDIYNQSRQKTQVAGLSTYFDLSCPCDSNRFVEYWGWMTEAASLSLTVKGWWT